MVLDRSPGQSLLPRWLAFVGLGIAAVAELSTLSLLVQNV
jgi:hypothetical protein